jgi:putative peptide zinc metalloprotease protein
VTAVRPARQRLDEDTTVEVRPLRYRCDQGCWTVGSPDTGDAVDVPEIAITVLRALEAGKTLSEAALVAEHAHGAQPDVLSFVEELAELGFVRLPDQRTDKLAAPEPAGLRLNWVTPRLVSWAFRPATVVLVAAFIVAAVSVAVVKGRLGVSYHAFFASRYPGVSLAWSLGVVTISALLHEFWHLAAARSAGIPARIGLSTRLVFLTAQTAAPLMWLASRRQRLCFYLAGMTSDLVLAAASILVAAECKSGTWPATMASSAALILLLGVLDQFAFCLRTDVYLVIQEMLRCRNLFEDARAYARFRVRSAGRMRRQRALLDPTLELPAHERQPVRLYSAFMVAGSAGLLIVTAVYWLPISIALYARASDEVASAQPWQVVDGLSTLAVETGSLALLICLLVLRWRRRSRSQSR